MHVIQIRTFFFFWESAIWAQHCYSHEENKANVNRKQELPSEKSKVYWQDRPSLLRCFAANNWLSIATYIYQIAIYAKVVI